MEAVVWCGAVCEWWGRGLREQREAAPVQGVDSAIRLRSCACCPPACPCLPASPCLPLQVRGVFDDMLATGLTPSIVAFNTLLASFAALGAWGEALDTLTHVMAAQVEGVNPNTCE